MSWQEQLAGHFIEATPVGSRVTCNPAPTHTDEDWLVFVTDVGDFCLMADKAEFLIGGSFADAADLLSHEMVSLKRESDAVNLLVTSSHEFAAKFLKATAIAKKLNLMKKEDRITLFQFVLYGKTPS